MNHEEREKEEKGSQWSIDDSEGCFAKIIKYSFTSQFLLLNY